jgi:hypothetical protein
LTARPQRHSSGWPSQRSESSLLELKLDCCSRANRAQRGSWPRRIGEAVNGVAAPCAGLARADLADPLEDFDLDALPGEASKEAADGVGRAARRLGDLRSASTFVTVLHILLAPASLKVTILGMTLPCADEVELR